ncbi:unnamed protein product [Candida verbasci]|uniref:glucan 1,3-beta-glucosidase n=1 Tax=Candida verbasci TaxID=1227364 RepID=A0A9W4XL19_9ASCO|nr:unnamed protein product [Candida verbasci]
MITIIFTFIYFIYRCVSRVNDINQLLDTSKLDTTKNFPNLIEPISKNKIYGVSLGGWLVSEPWITPELYENITDEFGNIPLDEYSLCLKLGKDKSETYLNNHYSTFIKESDFETISKMNLNLIRIPIGYWAFGLLKDDPYIKGIQEKYLDLAIEWSKKYNLKIQIGLHAMPESQNGFDNSGKTTDNPKWLSNRKNVRLSYKIIDYVLLKYGNNSNVHSIQVVNEPLGIKINQKRLIKFYSDMIEKFVNLKLSAKLVFHDAFYNMESFENFYPNTYILDHHLYEIFTDWQINSNLQEHLNHVDVNGESLSKTGQYSIVGEFSGALTDCTKYINGVGKGSRWDGTFYNQVHPERTCKDNDELMKNDIKLFLRKQFYTYEEKGNGWIFWTYKTNNKNNSLGWDFKRLYENDMLPDPLMRYNNKIKRDDEHDEVEHRKTLKKVEDVFDIDYDLGIRKTIKLSKSGGNAIKSTALIVLVDCYICIFLVIIFAIFFINYLTF